MATGDMEVLEALEASMEVPVSQKAQVGVSGLHQHQYQLLHQQLHQFQ